MLAALHIRNFVLIDRLDIEFGQGLSVLTGETGAGKSIIVDAIGLVTGERADASMVRNPENRTSVTATFRLPPEHSALEKLEHHEISPPADGEPLILRRTLSADGRSRAFVNDQPVTAGALRNIGRCLVEIEGQFAGHGLTDQREHRRLLDTFGNLAEAVSATRRAWNVLRDAREELARTRAEISRISAESEYLQHVHAELAELEPQVGEETQLAERRAVMKNGERIAEAIDQGLGVVTGDEGFLNRVGRATRAMERVNEQGYLQEALEAMDRTAAEAATAVEMLSDALARLERDAGTLEEIENRLFALRGLARKHKTSVDSLPGLKDSLERKLERLESGEQDLSRLEETAHCHWEAYRSHARILGEQRRKTATSLEKRVTVELPELRLEKARFLAVVETGDDSSGGEHGFDEVRFEVSTNPGLPPGPVNRVASGGELARLLLALRLVLFHADPVCTLVFDEVDAGIGGATAAAVAKRLHRLAGNAQVIVVTHSPQVAAQGISHYRVSKSSDSEHTTASVIKLSDGDRCEEIARMLAGAMVTDEARAAAASLIEGAEP